MAQKSSSLHSYLYRRQDDKPAALCELKQARGLGLDLVLHSIVPVGPISSPLRLG